MTSSIDILFKISLDGDRSFQPIVVQQRASLVPAAAVIPALQVCSHIVAVKTPVV